MTHLLQQFPLKRRINWLTVIIAVLALAAVVVWQWEFVWGQLPGAVGAPEETIVVTSRADQSDPEVRLAVLGDVGTGEPDALATANLVVESSSPDNFDGLVLLGDNVYPDGEPSRLDATILEPFGPVLDDGAALLAVLGNHDVAYGNGDAQVETLGLPGRWYSVEIESVLFIGLDSNLVADSEQTTWLETTLANSDPTQWVIVAMHHPAYSAGYHGATSDVQKSWVPLFEQYDVDLVLAGHDHDYQRMFPINGVHYIVSGGGSQLRATRFADYTSYAASVLHFVDIEVWDDRMDLTAVSKDGPFDQVTITADR